MMKIEGKTLKFLDEKCKKAWGINFDQAYHAVEQTLKKKEQLKQEQKTKKE